MDEVDGVDPASPHFRLKISNFRNRSGTRQELTAKHAKGAKDGKNQRMTPMERVTVKMGWSTARVMSRTKTPMARIRAGSMRLSMRLM